jgi:riboflavin kinase/FMN adenylyltransferase
LGKRPTFGGRGVALEVHLLDWSGELYGVELRVDFIARLRAEQTFASPQHLVEQIQMDIEHARERLS